MHCMLYYRQSLITTHTAKNKNKLILDFLLDGTLFVVGGLVCKKGSSKYTLSNKVSSMKAFEKGWEQHTCLPIRVCWPLVVTGNGYIYVIGGWGKRNNSTNTLQVYDRNKKSWTIETVPDCCDSVYCGAVFYRHTVIVFTLNCILVYDTHTNRWTQKKHQVKCTKLNMLTHEDSIFVITSNDDNKIEAYSYDTILRPVTNLRLDGCLHPSYIASCLVKP